MRANNFIIILTIITAIQAFPSISETVAPIAKMKVFIFAGQSNMVGAGRSEELPKDMFVDYKNVFIFRDDEWEIFKPVGRFGPELSFVHEAAKFWPQERIGIIKLAKGGTSLLDWDPDWTEEKSKITEGTRSKLYKKLMKQIALAREKEDFDVVGMIWMQGARDAKYKQAADTYALNFQTFIERVRKDMGKPELPFVFGRSTPPESAYPYIAKVQQAQAAVAEKLPNTVMINTDGLSKKSDQTHLDTRGQLDLGRRFATAYFDLLNTPDTNK